MSSYDSLNARLKELTGQLDQKDTELDQEVDDIIETDLDELDESIEGTEKDLKEGLRKKVEAVKMGIKDRKDRLRERVEGAPKDRARKEADDALNSMEEDLSKGDLVAAHIDRWVAHQWLKASK
jgi:ABC-type transporter Mla subunit MlaD